MYFNFHSLTKQAGKIIGICTQEETLTYKVTV